MSLPLLAVTMGDPAGIGGEIAARALAEAETYGLCRPLIVGDACVMREALRVCGLDMAVNAIEDPADGRYVPGVLDVLDLAAMTPADHQYGKISARQGNAAFRYVAKAIELALVGRVDATVTGPINKESLNLAGHHYAGHTEIYAELTGTKDYTMMLADGDFRVVHVSTHVSLRQACDRVKAPRVLRVIELAEAALRQLGIEAPRIGVAGLNPHCGEAGLFGTEDEADIRPAVEQARAKGIAAEGPLPADTIFSKMAGGLFDIVVAMYHDQGHIPTKLVGFKYDAAADTWGQMAGVNITLGLPIIRVSVDHGTAFDRAGTGTANPQSLHQAIQYAARFAEGRAGR
jgi:4-hydroxythreonine-4-phosphate dehydrogenase